jgi:cell division septum initiation protein DivIVA
MPAFEPADQRPSQQAQQLLAAAERDARQLVRGAESYADDVLSTLELEVDKALQIIRNGRQFLEMRRQNGSTGN